MSTTAPDQTPNLRLVTVVLAVACGATVANLYYCQPLLPLLSSGLHVSHASAALIVTLTQIGYAIGLVLLLPLGDLLENRLLASRLLIVTAATLAVAAGARGFGLFAAMSVLIGVTSVVAQVLVPLAAHLAPEAERGRFVGRVMSGLLLGILLARTVASVVAAQWGWRSIYVISAVLMLVMSLCLARVLPTRRPEPGHHYLSLLRSLGPLIWQEPALRRRAVCQALMFGTFSAFWTSIAYQLVGQFGLSQTGIGLFALVGAAGAAAAPLAGWLADHGHSTAGSGAAIGAGLLGMLLAGVGTHSLVGLAIAAVVLDLGVQGHQVLSQGEIYSLRADARARINSIFMGTNFTGGALASALSGVLHDRYGWSGVVILGIVMSSLALTVWAVAAVLGNGPTSVATEPASIDAPYKS